MNREKEEISIIRKARFVCEGALRRRRTNRRKPMEVDARREKRRRVTFDLNKPTFQIMVQVQCDGAWCENGACVDGLRVLGERESEEQVTPMLVTWAMLVPRKCTELPLITRRAAKFFEQRGHNKVTRALAKEIAQARQEGSQTVLERPLV